MPKYEGGRISPSGVSPKWVKSKRRKRRRNRAKVNDYNGQYLLPEPIYNSGKIVNSGNINIGNIGNVNAT